MQGKSVVATTFSRTDSSENFLTIILYSSFLKDKWTLYLPYTSQVWNSSILCLQKLLYILLNLRNISKMDYLLFSILSFSSRNHDCYLTLNKIQQWSTCVTVMFFFSLLKNNSVGNTDLSKTFLFLFLRCSTRLPIFLPPWSGLWFVLIQQL